MRIEACALKIADRVRVPGHPEGEVVRRHGVGPNVRVWFRGDEGNEEPSMVFDETSTLEVTRPGELVRRKQPVDSRRDPIVDASPQSGGELQRERAAASVPDSAPPVETRRRGRPADRQGQAEKLREVANRLRQGRHSERSARALMLAAEKVEHGALTYLARLTTRPQVDDLELALAEARRERATSTNERLGRAPELGDIPFARFTGVAVWKSDLRELVEHASERVDERVLGRLRVLAQGEDQRLELFGDDVDRIRACLIREGRAKLSTRIEWIADRLERHNRLGRLGVRDTKSLRAALHEYLACHVDQEPHSDDLVPIAELELPEPRTIVEGVDGTLVIDPLDRMRGPALATNRPPPPVRSKPTPMELLVELGPTKIRRSIAFASCSSEPSKRSRAGPSWRSGLCDVWPGWPGELPIESATQRTRDPSPAARC